MAHSIIIFCIKNNMCPVILHAYWYKKKVRQSFFEGVMIFWLRVEHHKTAASGAANLSS